MAFANNINKDMTAADARAVAGSSSWSDIYPDGFDFEADPMEFLGEHRLFFDTHGNPHFAGGKNPFSGELAEAIRNGEKDGLLTRGLNGKIRDTRSRYGEPKEWDHVVVGLTRAEAEALGPDGVKDWAKTVIRAMQDSPDGTGKRQMLVTPIHDDTDNIHLQFLLHRIPVNESNLSVGASYELSRNSEAAGQMKQLNTALEAAGLPMISDFRMGAYSVSEPRAVSVEELNRAAERIEEAGGVTPPDLTTGPTSLNSLQAARARVTPEMRHLDAMLADAVKRQKDIESQATAAATAVAAAQHAKEALSQFEAEVAAHEALKVDHEALKEVAKKQREKIEEDHEIRMKLVDELSSTTANLDTLRSDYSAIQLNFDKLMETQAATSAKVEDLTNVNEGLKTDLKAANEDLAQATAEADQNRKLAEAHAKSLQEANAEIATLKTTSEVARKEIADLKRQRAELDVQAKDALQAAETARGALSVAEAEKQAMATQIEALKAQLANATTSYNQLESNFSTYKENESVAAQNSLQAPPGDSGMTVLATAEKDRKKPNYDELVKVKVGWFSTVITTPTAKLTGNAHGIKSDATIDNLTAATMIEFAKSQGWNHIQPTGSDLEISLLVKHAAEAGITVEGWTKPAPKASIVAADVKSEPVKYDGRDWSKKHPDSWVEGDMPAASKSWEAAKERGEVTGSLKDWATVQFEKSQSAASIAPAAQRKWFEKTGDVNSLSNADRMSAERALERKKAKGQLKDANLEQFVKATHDQWLDQEAKKNADQNGLGKNTKPK